MSRILVMGNILKDVYLNLDERTAKFETDREGTKWLNLSFNASDYHFYRRNSSYGGAAVSLEVLKKLGHEVKIMGSDLDLNNDGLFSRQAPSVYRYILVADDSQIAYFTPSLVSTTNFIAPTEPTDYLYIDRSVELTESVAKEIESFLISTPTVKLVIYLKKTEHFHERRLLSRAELVFAEEKTDLVSDDKLVLNNEKFLRYRDLSEPITLMRPDLATHLSLYSTAAATIFGAFALGKPMAEALKLAHANVENSQLDKTLDLNQMEELAANYGAGGADLELVAKTLLIGGKGIFDLSAAAIEQKEHFVMNGIADNFINRQDYYSNLLMSTPLSEKYNGAALTEEASTQFTDDGRNFIDYLTDNRVMPGIVIEGEVNEDECKKFVSMFRQWGQMGVGFLKWNLPAEGDRAEVISSATKFARCALTAGLVPVIDTTRRPENHLDHKVIDSLAQNDLNLKACIVL